MPRGLLARLLRAWRLAGRRPRGLGSRAAGHRCDLSTRDPRAQRSEGLLAQGLHDPPRRTPQARRDRRRRRRSAQEHHRDRERRRRRKQSTVKDPEKVAILTQTTLSIDEASEITAVLKRRFPSVQSQEKDDICYATTNRQEAVKALSPDVQLWLVIGDPTSSNSNRLRELGDARGVAEPPHPRSGRDPRESGSRESKTSASPPVPRRRKSPSKA